MDPKIINPDSTVLQQVEGYWQKLATMILWKLNGREPVTITAVEMAQMTKEFEPDGPVLFTHGHVDSLEFRIVTVADAERIAAYDKTLRGTA